MSPERWEKLKLLFDAALELTDRDRSVFLDRACVGDAQIREEVKSLLAAHSHTFLERPAELEGDVAEARSVGAVDEPELVGTQVDFYEIVERIASGGMGDVFRARHIPTSQPVAIKRLSSKALADPRNRRRFEQEARAAKALDHPNVVGIHGLIDRGGDLFLVMDLVQGSTLRKILDARRLEVPEALQIAIQTASALVHAHRLGIVHRDVKPDNVMLSEAGQVKLVDFGLVKLIEPENIHDAPTIDQRSMSREGLVVGSASYMSPEQINGSALDGRSDVFSLGAIMYEMLAGRRAFDGRTALEIVSSILWDDPAPLTQDPALPDALADVVARALQKNPEDRFSSMAQLLESLERIDPDAPIADPKQTHAKSSRLSATTDSSLSDLARRVKRGFE